MEEVRTNDLEAAAGSRRTYHFLLTLRNMKVREETEKDARTMLMETAKSNKEVKEANQVLVDVGKYAGH